MAHPRIEEVSDSDDYSDPSEADIDSFTDNDILLRVSDPSPQAPQTQPSKQPVSLPPRNQPPSSHQFPTTSDPSQYADYQCLYPIYFDSTRSRASGRRVPSSLAVPNPLSREIAHACAALRIPACHEPAKCHPNDWANPGRVRVKLSFDTSSGERAPAGMGVAPGTTKRALYVLIAQHLRKHPATDGCEALRAPIPGVPVMPPSGAWPVPAVPRGWKLGELLPYISPAMTGGGVSENLFADMMKGMQGGGDPMAALMNGAMGGGAPPEPPAGKKKKDKKGKGKS